MNRILGMMVALGAGLALAAGTGGARAGSIFNGTLYFTHFTGGENVWSDPFSYDQTTQTLTMGPSTGIAAVNGADGIIFDANGHLLIGGQGNPVVHMINPNGSFVADGSTAGSQSYHLALDPTGTKVYTSNFGGPLVTVPLTATGFGGPATVTAITGGDSGVTQLAFDPKTGQTFYDDGSPNCCGDFGTLNLSTGVTAKLGNGTAVHGMIYDSFTGLIDFFGGGFVGTYNPGTGIYSQSLINGDNFDQGAVDGFGHAFIAGGNQVTFLDYSISGDITHPDKVIVENDPNFNGIDDVAPLSGLGSNPVPEPSSLALLATSLLGLLWWGRRRVGRG